MPAFGGAKTLRLGQSVIEIIADQAYFDGIATEYLGFLNFLLGRRDRHENNAAHAKMLAHIGHALRMIASTCTYKQLLIGAIFQHLAHGIERTAQFIAAHWR